MWLRWWDDADVELLSAPVACGLRHDRSLSRHRLIQRPFATRNAVQKNWSHFVKVKFTLDKYFCLPESKNKQILLFSSWSCLSHLSICICCLWLRLFCQIFVFYYSNQTWSLFLHKSWRSYELPDVKFLAEICFISSSHEMSAKAIIVHCRNVGDGLLAEMSKNCHLLSWYYCEDNLNS